MYLCAPLVGQNDSKAIFYKTCTILGIIIFILLAKCWLENLSQIWHLFTHCLIFNFSVSIYPTSPYFSWKKYCHTWYETTLYALLALFPLFSYLACRNWFPQSKETLPPVTSSRDLRNTNFFSLASSHPSKKMLILKNFQKFHSLYLSIILFQKSYTSEIILEFNFRCNYFKKWSWSTKFKYSVNLKIK